MDMNKKDNKNMFSTDSTGSWWSGGGRSQTTGSSNIFVANPKLRSLLLIFIAVFLVSGIGLIAFASWQKQYREKIYNETKAGLPVHPVHIVKKPVDQNNENTELKASMTYRNEKYGFELKHPTDIKVIFNNDTLEIAGNGDTPSSYVYMSTSTSEGVVSQILKRIKTDNLQANSKLISNTKVYFAGEPATEITSERNQYGCCGEYRATINEQILSHNGITYHTKRENNQFADIFSTFKFTDYTLDTSQWKTYRNEENGFEFKYPSYFEVLKNSSQYIFAISTKAGRDNLSIAGSKTSDGYVLDNSPAGFSCLYDEKNKSWIIDQGAAADQQYCPSSVSNSNIDAYIGGIADGAGAVDMGFILDNNKNIFWVIRISRGYGGDVCSNQKECPEDYPVTSIETLKSVLSTFKFTK